MDLTANDCLSISEYMLIFVITSSYGSTTWAMIAFHKSMLLSIVISISYFLSSIYFVLTWSKSVKFRRLTIKFDTWAEDNTLKDLLIRIIFTLAHVPWSLHLDDPSRIGAFWCMLTFNLSLCLFRYNFMRIFLTIIYCFFGSWVVWIGFMIWVWLIDYCGCKRTSKVESEQRMSQNNQEEIA